MNKQAWIDYIKARNELQAKIREARKIIGCDTCKFEDVCVFQIRFEDGHCIKRECGVE